MLLTSSAHEKQGRFRHTFSLYNIIFPPNFQALETVLSGISALFTNQ